jgi:hypothetical protein
VTRRQRKLDCWIAPHFLAACNVMRVIDKGGAFRDPSADPLRQLDDDPLRAADTEGAWNFTSSSRAWPSGVSTIAISARTPSSPTTRSTEPPLPEHAALQL